jgi:hypothetical protein
VVLLDGSELTCDEAWSAVQKQLAGS